MAAIAYNLKKMLKFKSKTVMAATMILTEEAHDFFVTMKFYAHYYKLALVKI
jgi:hypothetical protein